MRETVVTGNWVGTTHRLLAKYFGAVGKSRERERGVWAQDLGNGILSWHILDLAESLALRGRSLWNGDKGPPWPQFPVNHSLNPLILLTCSNCLHHQICFLHVVIHLTNRQWYVYIYPLLDLVKLIVKHRSGQFVTETTFVTSETEAFGEALSICELWMEVNWRVEDDLRPRGWRNRQIKDDKVSDSCILAELAALELAPLLAQDKRRPVGQNWEGKKIDFSPQPLFIFPCSLNCCLFLRLSRLFCSIFSWLTTAAVECF